ncbi:response regulator [Agaribacterium haliotis]|uniref:response regulator n=1 Tax=Agaribacterium haliotis TaxID=2013869 RepID=UPI000BB5863C|nr:response regulator [Agaribacterium haliotis]
MPFKVLVVDDASFVRDTIKRHLRPLIPDLEVHEAPDGRRACSLVKTKQPQLILSDWEMPEMSGAQFLQWLRSEDAYKNIPFIMVSSRGDREYVVAAIKAGVNDYLSKPFTPDELHKKVIKQLKRLGYRPPKKAQAASMQSSADILTGSAVSAKQVIKPRAIKDAGFGKAAEKAPAKAASPKSSTFSGSAVLRFAKYSLNCEVRELSLQAINGLVERKEIIPALFDQVSVDISDADGNALARVNAYVHAIIAAENRPDAEKLKLTVRFVDNDAEKFEALSKAIAL